MQEEKKFEHCRYSIIAYDSHGKANGYNLLLSIPCTYSEFCHMMVNTNGYGVYFPVAHISHTVPTSLFGQQIVQQLGLTVFSS